MTSANRIPERRARGPDGQLRGEWAGLGNERVTLVTHIVAPVPG